MRKYSALTKQHKKGEKLTREEWAEWLQRQGDKKEEIEQRRQVLRTERAAADNLLKALMSRVDHLVREGHPS